MASATDQAAEHVVTTVNKIYYDNICANLDKLAELDLATWENLFDVANSVASRGQDWRNARNILNEQLSVAYNYAYEMSVYEQTRAIFSVAEFARDYERILPGEVARLRSSVPAFLHWNAKEQMKQVFRDFRSWTVRGEDVVVRRSDNLSHVPSSLDIPVLISFTAVGWTWYTLGHHHEG